MTVGWKDIAGLESVVEELRDTVILPIQKRDMFANSKLNQAPKGVLLHGPPGCGKTVINRPFFQATASVFVTWRRLINNRDDSLVLTKSTFFHFPLPDICAK